MNQATREKIALIVFVALIVGTLTGIVAYMQVGHSWNRAAITIDDARGDMDGYIAIVYRGVCMPSMRESADSRKPVPVSSVLRAYRDKGAHVMRLEVLHPQIYDGEDIFLAASQRIGVFYAPSTKTPFAIERNVSWFRDHDVDLIVCVADDASTIAHHSEGIDIVVSLSNDELFRTGTTIDDTYYVNAPVVGKVGTIFITPEGFVYSKETDEIPAR